MFVGAVDVPVFLNAVSSSDLDPAAVCKPVRATVLLQKLLVLATILHDPVCLTWSQHSKFGIAGMITSIRLWLAIVETV